MNNSMAIPLALPAGVRVGFALLGSLGTHPTNCFSHGSPYLPGPDVPEPGSTRKRIVMASHAG